LWFSDSATRGTAEVTPFFLGRLISGTKVLQHTTLAVLQKHLQNTKLVVLMTTKHQFSGTKVLQNTFLQALLLALVDIHGPSRVCKALACVLPLAAAHIQTGMLTYADVC
jgi:hypothetical protein